MKVNHVQVFGILGNFPHLVFKKQAICARMSLCLLCSALCKQAAIRKKHKGWHHSSYYWIYNAFVWAFSTLGWKWRQTYKWEPLFFLQWWANSSHYPWEIFFITLRESLLSRQGYSSLTSCHRSQTLWLPATNHWKHHDTGHLHNV